jgi:hypothetical protein
MFTAISEFWTWLKLHDAPNWFAVFFSLVVWPLVLVWWSTRKRQSVPNLELIPRPGQTIIRGAQHHTVDLTFTNRTGSVVYLYNARLRENQKHFPVPMAADRDMSGGWRELKFGVQQNNAIVFTEHHQVLQTSDSAITNIAVSRHMDNSFYSYRPGWLRRLFRCPKYFRLEFTAMAGTTKYSVATIY